MRNWKVVSTGDWAKMMGAMFCCILLGQSSLREFLRGEYVEAVYHLLGIVGWVIIYLMIVKRIDRRNGIK